MKQTTLAKRIATKAHEGKARKDGTTPYITHPAAVAAWLKANGETSDKILAAAWIHDVIEDTNETAESLRIAGIDEDVITAVLVLTNKRDGTSNGAYIRGVKANAIARRVKVADMISNLASEPTQRQITRYARNLLFLSYEDKPKPAAA